jgi:hypothetical protein
VAQQVRLFADTTPEAEAVLLARLRQMTPTRRLHMMAQLNRQMRGLALTGIRRRHPQAAPAEQQRRLATLLLGDQIADAAYGAATYPREEDTMSNDVTQVTVRVIEVLEALGVPYLIGGSLASTLHGVARTTLDSDIVADLRPEHVAPFIHALRDEFYLSPAAVVEAVALHTSFNLIHLATAFKVDIFLARDRPFDRTQFMRCRAQVIDEQTGRAAMFASAEDTILAKLEWHQLGGEQSVRQWQDLLGVVLTQDTSLDWVYMRAMAATLQVSDLLDRLYEGTRPS